MGKRTNFTLTEQKGTSADTQMISSYACFSVLVLLRPHTVAVSRTDELQWMPTLPQRLVYPMATFPKQKRRTLVTYSRFPGGRWKPLQLYRAAAVSMPRAQSAPSPRELWAQSWTRVTPWAFMTCLAPMAASVGTFRGFCYSCCKWHQVQRHEASGLSSQLSRWIHQGDIRTIHWAAQCNIAQEEGMSFTLSGDGNHGHRQTARLEIQTIIQDKIQQLYQYHGQMQVCPLSTAQKGH